MNRPYSSTFRRPRRKKAKVNIGLYYIRHASEIDGSLDVEFGSKMKEPSYKSRMESIWKKRVE